jgi:hypothetical protein
MGRRGLGVAYLNRSSLTKRVEVDGEQLPIVVYLSGPGGSEQLHPGHSSFRQAPTVHREGASAMRWATGSGGAGPCGVPRLGAGEK